MNVKFSDLAIINVAWETYTQLDVLTADGERKFMTFEQCYFLYGDCYVEYVKGNEVMLRDMKVR